MDEKGAGHITTTAASVIGDATNTKARMGICTSNSPSTTSKKTVGGMSSSSGIFAPTNKSLIPPSGMGGTAKSAGCLCAAATTSSRKRKRDLLLRHSATGVRNATFSSSVSPSLLSDSALTGGDNDSDVKLRRETVPETPLPVLLLRAVFSQSERGKEILMRNDEVADDSNGNYNQHPKHRPTQEFVDAYDVDVANAIRKGDVAVLRSMLRDEGRSFDASNRFGESLIHMACRRAGPDVVAFMVHEAECTVDVRDDFGRTPVHDALWTPKPNFEVMDALLRVCPLELLLAEDVRGHTPFHYARKEHWGDWTQYLRSRSKLIMQRLDVAPSSASTKTATATT